jgi:GNAT superfamily N-acetyltransferase
VIARLEAIAFRAWPAATVVARRGVLLRATGGESRRANSAALHACDEGVSAVDAIAIAEEFYRARAMEVQLQIGPTAPPGTDAELAARGYAIAAPVRAQIADASEVLARAADRASAATAIVAPEPDAAWIDVEVTRGRYAEIESTFVRLMRGLGPRAGFGVARVGADVAAACLFVHDEDTVVIAAMRTLAELRRRGAARALVHAGAAWALGRCATRMYLQVDRDNAAAIPLYAACGFADLYEYHYRVRA